MTVIQNLWQFEGYGKQRNPAPFMGGMNLFPIMKSIYAHHTSNDTVAKRVLAI